jgi:hypothetical protein
VEEHYEPVAAGYELHSLKQTGKFERKGIAPNGLKSTLGECGVESCGGYELAPDDTRRGVTEMWVTLGQETVFGERTVPDVVKLRVLEERLTCLIQLYVSHSVNCYRGHSHGSNERRRTATAGS